RWPLNVDECPFQPSRNSICGNVHVCETAEISRAGMLSVRKRPQRLTRGRLFLVDAGELAAWQVCSVQTMVGDRILGREHGQLGHPSSENIQGLWVQSVT
ncbi:hypothetical protein, partial [Pseudarthrobacter sp. NPDC080039]|uniref:hypothetical protein n=1 Tax=Pseudarthrobacter sp. NPDC080039 TaxID=3155290 RepID=UPI00344FA31A